VAVFLCYLVWCHNVNYQLLILFSFRLDWVLKYLQSPECFDNQVISNQFKLGNKAHITETDTERNQQLHRSLANDVNDNGYHGVTVIHNVVFVYKVVSWFDKADHACV